MGADQPNFFQNHISSVHLHISCKFFLSNDILTILPIQMHGQPMLTLPLNRSRSSKGHNLYIHCSTPVPDTSCQVSLKSVQWFRRRRILKGFYHVWPWRPSCHVTWIIYKHIGSPFLYMLHSKFGFDWPSGFRGEDL